MNIPSLTEIFSNSAGDSISSTGNTMASLHSETQSIYAKANKKYYPTSSGYADRGVFQVSPKQMKTILDKTVRINDFRRKQPKPYQDNITFTNRLDKITKYHLRLGDCVFLAIPETIEVKETSQTEQQVAIRQTNSIKMKYGYKRREIQINLTFNGLEQINGYEIDSPFDYKYKVDGLVPLIYEFKCTPFLPVVNELLNNTYGIYTVALKYLTINTVPGFPKLMEATLFLEEFNATPYIEAPNILFDSMIDWDLFRYYYQKVMHDRLGDTKISFDNKFAIKVLKDEVFNKKDKSFTDPKNFYTLVSDSDGITISQINITFTNILPIIQMSLHETPTMQYMGGSDIVYTVTFETENRNAISAIETMISKVDETVRKERKCNGMGYVLFDNELMKLDGHGFVMIDETDSATVQGFPDDFIIQMRCISYDGKQRDMESLNGFHPFNGKADITDTISQSTVGLKTKIKQDMAAERKMLQLELYPDLCLPTFDEVNSAITAINKFRVKSGLKALDYMEYVGEQSYYPGLGDNWIYNLYVDPDFYMFYPYKYSDIDDSNFDVLKGTNTPIPCSVIAPNHEYGENPADYGLGTSNNNSSISGTGSLGKFMQLAASKVGCGYIWGASGQTASDSTLYQLSVQFGTGGESSSDRARWKGKQVFDCSGFVSWLLIQCGVMKSGRENCSGLQSYCNLKTYSSSANLSPGDLIFRGGDHVAIYAGGGHTYEAHSVKDGVIFGNASGRNWTVYGSIKGLSGSVSSSSSSSNSSSNSSSSSGSSSNCGYKGPYLNSILKYSKQYNLDPNLVCSVIQAESSFRNLSPNSCGATGLMQVQQSTASSVGVSGSMSDTDANIHAGCAYIRQMLNLSGNNIETAMRKYNCGPYSKNLNNSTTNAYISNIKSFYKSYSNGKDLSGSAGSDSGDSSSDDMDMFNNAQSADAGKTFNDKIYDYKNYQANFGKPIYAESPIEDKKNYDSFNNTEDYISPSCVDMCYYSQKGKLVRAFPSYVFMILDENDQWYEGRKFWSNYYIYRSLVSISINSEKGSPAKTAEISVTNLYENLTKFPKTSDIFDSLNSDKDISGFDKFMYRYFGTMFGGPKITSTMLQKRSELYKSILINAGCRIHLRLGYGSNPLKYNIAFNGTITEMNTSDIITIVAQSDGLELANNPISSKKKETNSISKLQSEPSDIIASLLCDRDNWVIEGLSGGKYCEKSKYGIEHFGLRISSTSDEGSLKETPEGKEIVKKKKDKEIQYDMEQNKKMVEDGNILQKIEGVLGDGWDETKRFAGGIANFVMGNTIIQDVTLPIIEAGKAIANITVGKQKTANHNQYDLCKNIYVGKYKASPFTKDEGFLMFDGEDNINMYLCNRVPWDIMQLCAQFLPEFLCRPEETSFENTLFYGLGTWLYKYKYDLNAKTGKIYEYAKNFSQFHYIDNLSDIIDNQIKATSTNLKENCIATYSLGGDAKTAPTCYADRSITWSKQRTKIIDTTVVQDYIGWDWLYEKTFFPIAQSAAIKIAISNILSSFNSMYDEPITILGDPTIKPCDYLYINDNYTKMYGLTEVREVTHMMTPETGFISDIIPSLIGGSTMQHSGNANVLRTFTAMGSSIGAIKLARASKISFLGLFGKIISKGASVGSKIASPIADYFANNSKTANSFMNMFRNAKKGADMAKEAETITDSVETTSKIGNAIKDTVSIAKDVSALAGANAGGDIGAIAGSVVPGIGNIVGFVIGTALFNSVFECILSQFEYNSCIWVQPLIYNGNPFIMGVNGFRTLIPGFNDSDEKYKSDEQA